MRILVVAQSFWPEEFRINELVAQLVERGHTVTVLTGVPNYPGGRVFPEYAAAPEKYREYAGARVIRVPMLTRGQSKIRLLLNYVIFAASATLVGMARLRRDDFDAVFVFEPSPVTVGVPAVAFRAVRGWPIAFWVLDQWPETLAAVGVVRSERILRMVGRFVRFLYTRCDVILSPSRLLMPQIATYCEPGQRIEYFPNWVEGAYGAGEIPRAPEVPARADTFDVMFAGNIGAAQDFPAILDAAELLRDDERIRWLIVGDGRMASWVRDEIARRGLTDRVLMLGRHPSERMPSFFACADALLVSLRKEPIFAMTAPGKLQSYLAFGSPILAMLDGEGAAVVQEAAAGLTSPAGEPRALADNVLRLAAMSAEERERMGRAGAEYAQREFSRDRLMDRVEGALRDIAARARRDATGARAPRVVRSN